MLIWLYFIALFVLFILNISLAVKEDNILEKYSSDILKIVRQDNLSVTVPEQVPLSHIQKLRLIGEIKRMPISIENETISENDSSYRKIRNLRSRLGWTTVGLIFGPLLLKYLF